MKVFYLAMLFFTSTIVLTAQSRVALESQRMDVLKEIESLEIELKDIKMQQAVIYRKMDGNQRNGKLNQESSSSADQEVEEELDNITIDSTAELISEIENEDSDYEVLVSLNEKLLNIQARELQVAEHEEISADFLARKMILARHQKQVAQALSSKSASNSYMESNTDMEFEKGEIPLSEAMEEPEIDSAPNEVAYDAEIEDLLTGSTNLTDASGRIKLKMAGLTSKLETLNQQIEYEISGGKVPINIATLDGVKDVIVAPKVIATLSNSNFLANRGFLSWPMKDAIIVARYGQQQHKDIPGIQINNKGIDLRSGISEVSCISDGVIEKVSMLENLKTIIVKHEGNYFTVYSGLLNASVSIGESVVQGSYLGHAAGNEMHFEIWEGDKNQNPSHWLKNN